MSDQPRDPKELRAQAARYLLLRRVITDERTRDALEQTARKLNERANRLEAGDGQQDSAAEA
jgi:hypothetical protein